MREDRQERFTASVETLAEVIGHADRAAPLPDYCRGLLLPGERKSVEPIAAVRAPARVSAKHQSLRHFVANAPWSNQRVLGRIHKLSLPIIEGSGAIEAWIIDDTGFPKIRSSLARGGAPVLRSTRQAGQLPDCGQPVAGQSCGAPADRLAPLSGAGVDSR